MKPAEAAGTRGRALERQDWMGRAGFQEMFLVALLSWGSLGPVTHTTTFAKGIESLTLPDTCYFLACQPSKDPKENDMHVVV